MQNLHHVLISSFILLAFTGSTHAADKKSNASDKNSKVEADKNPKVLLKTSEGDITLELDPAKAPISVKNFLDYVNSGQYDNTIFHRVIPGFMIQGGGMTKDMSEKSTKSPIKNEATNGLKNENGTIAMARTSDIDSATSQFFINVTDNTPLDHSPSQYGYAVFGKVIKGMDVVNKIEKVKTKNVGRNGDVPVEPIIIESAKVIK